MSLTLKDLRVVPSGTGLRNLKLAELRPVSLADLVEVLKQEGAETIWWCENHKSNRITPGYRCDHYRHLRATGNEGSDCRMVERLVLPLGDTP